MKKYLFIIGITIMCFSGCSSQRETYMAAPKVQTPNAPLKEEQKTSSGLVEKIKESRDSVQKTEKSAELTLEIIQENDSQITAALLLNNPLQKDIASVRAVIAYNPEILSGTSVKIADASPFRIVAPGENSFHSKKGLVKIGVSATEEQVFTGQETPIAEMTFLRNKNTFTSLDLYGSGDAQKTIVLQKNGEELIDVLRPPKIPTLPLLPSS